MFSNAATAVQQQQKVPQIFSLQWISSSPSPFILPNTKKVTGYNLLTNNQWLLRSSSLLGALTVDYNKNNSTGSVRFILTDSGWIMQEDSNKNLKINTNPDKALKYAPQLFVLLNSLPWLEGLIQILPRGGQVETEVFYNAYNLIEVSEPADAKSAAPRLT